MLPPRLFDRFLEWYCRPELLEDIQGDLYELFSRRVREEGLRRARFRYAWDVVRSCRPHLLRSPQIHPPMFTHYTRIAFRSMRKTPGYSFTNVAGLAVGMACCAFILLYVRDELSYDRFHEHADRIVRVVEDRNVEGQSSQQATTYGPLAPALKQDLPAVAHAVRVLPYSLLVGREGGNRFQEDAFVFVDSTFFDVFTFPLIRGDAGRALAAPFSVVLTETTARKYFGEADPLGQTLLVRGDQKSFDFTVTGVVADPPVNTHLQFDLLGSFSSMRAIYSPWIEDPRNWDHPPLYTYALLATGVSASALEARMPAFAQQRMGDRRTATRSLHVQRLTDIHLRSGRENELTPGSDMVYVYLFGLVAFFILCIACVNFVNLSTARAAGRAKEVGMRKALGAHRGQLVRQFLTESMVTVTLALSMAVALVIALLPAFSSLSGKALTSAPLMVGLVPLGLLGTLVLVGLLAGAYPALYLSGFRPTRVLKGSDGGKPAAAMVRKGLVVFQFTVSIVLLLGTIIVFRQLDYARSERLGFDKEHVITVPLRELANQMSHESIRDAWRQVPGVAAVTASSGMPGLGEGLHDFFVFPDGSRGDSLELMTLTVDHAYAETYGLDIVAGRDFDEAFTTDATGAFLLNESAVRRLGWIDAVGQKLSLRYYFQGEQLKEGTVVGVVRDFQYHSLHRAIDPIVFHILPGSYYYDYLSVRLHPGDVPRTLASLEQVWRGFNPERPFEYTFLDVRFDALYRAEARLSRLLGTFAGLAIFIACLGLFGLAAYTAEQRTREIGIRKVMGATVPGLVLLLSKDFVRLVAFAFLLGAPLAYIAMHRWLEAFADRIDLRGEEFLVVGLGMLGIALATVSYQAMRAALTDPVKALRHE